MGWLSKDGDDLKKRSKVITKELEEDEEEESEDTYELDVECENCSYEESYEIDCGTLVRDYLRGKVCEYCGCPVISKIL